MNKKAGANVLKRIGASVAGLMIELVNWSLVFLTLLQVIILVMSVFEAEIPVPRFLLWKIKEAMAQEGFDARWQTIKFDRLGHLHARGFEIALASGSEELIARSESALMGLDLSDLTVGKVTFNRFQLTNATFYCPAMFSSSGLTMPVLERMNCYLLRSGAHWEVRQMNFRVHNLRVNADGFWHVSHVQRRGVKAGDERPLIERYIDFCIRMLDLQEPLQNLKDPVLAVKLNAVELGFIMADLDLSSEEWKMPGDALLGPFRLLAEDVRLDDYKTTRPVKLTTEYFLGGQNWFIKDLQVVLFVDSLHPKKIIRPRRILFSTPRLDGVGVTVRNLAGSAITQAYPMVSGQVYLQLDGGSVKLQGEIDVEKGSGFIKIDSTADINNLLQHPKLSKNNFKSYWNFPAPPRIKASLSLTDQFTFDRLEFNIDAEPIIIKGAQFERVHARGKIVDGMLSIPDFTVENSGARIRGSYEENMQSRDYRFLLSGSAYPSDLNPLLLDWWDNLWAQFDFDSGPMTGDVDVQGRWLQLDRTQVFAAANGTGFRFRDIELNACRAKVWANYYNVEVFDLEANRPEGDGSGSLYWQWAKDVEGKGPLSIYVNLESQMNLPVLITLAGGDFKALGDNFLFTAPPQIRVRGIYRKDTEGNPAGRDIFVRAQSEAPLIFRGLPLDYLSLDAHFQESRSLFDKLSFGFAGGNGKGRFEVEKTKESSELGFSIDLSGADHLRAFDSLSLLPTNSHTKEQSKKLKQRDQDGGKLDLRLSASGDPGEIQSLTGEGEFKIVEAELGKFHLFGGLSRILSVTGLNFTTLILEEAQGSFSLAESRINFPELLVTGPHTVIRAKGDILLPDLQLDFNVKVFMLEKSEFPVILILGPLLRPFGYAFGATLRGTVREPQWPFTTTQKQIIESAREEGEGKIAPTRPTPIY